MDIRVIRLALLFYCKSDGILLWQRLIKLVFLWQGPAFKGYNDKFILGRRSRGWKQKDVKIRGRSVKIAFKITIMHRRRKKKCSTTSNHLANLGIPIDRRRLAHDCLWACVPQLYPMAVKQTRRLQARHNLSAASSEISERKRLREC